MIKNIVESHLILSANHRI